MSNPHGGNKAAIEALAAKVDDYLAPRRATDDEIFARLDRLEKLVTRVVARLDDATVRIALNPERAVKKRLDEIEKITAPRLERQIETLLDDQAGIIRQIEEVVDETNEKLARSLSTRRIEPQKPPDIAKVDPRDCLFGLLGDREYLDPFFSGIMGEQVNDGDAFELVCTRTKEVSPRGHMHLKFRLRRR